MHFNFSPGVLSIETDMKRILGYFVENMVPIPSDEPPKLVITVRKGNTNAMRQQLSTHLWSCSGEPGVEIMLHRHRIIPGMTMDILFKDLTTPNPTVILSRGSYQYLRLSIGSLLPVGVHLRHVTATTLLGHGYSLVHAAGVARNGQAVLIAGSPDIGKTTTCLAACRQGFEFLGEDIVITDGSYIYPLPPVSGGIVRGAEKVRLSSRWAEWKFFISRSAYETIPALLALPVPIPELLIDDVDPPLARGRPTKASLVIILERSPQSEVIALDKAEARRRLIMWNRFEFPYETNKALLMYSYFNPNFDLQRLRAVEEERLASLVNNADCLILRADDPRKYVSLFREVMGL